MGAYLAEFKDIEEEKHVSSFLQIGDFYWIGLDDLSEEGTIKFEDAII